MQHIKQYARLHTYSLKNRVDKIIAKLREIKMNGGQPIVIFDEAENLEISVLKMIKALFDALKDYCSLVMIGTPQLLEKLTNKKSKRWQRTQQAAIAATIQAF
jgi:type II secretory pathway predicted ATPase ExeA